MFQPLMQSKVMYKKNIYKIVENSPLTPSIWRMVLEGDTQYLTRPGQFVNIELAGHYLRRPISVCDWDATTLTIIYKVVGAGTEQMSGMECGEKLDILTGLGNGFDADRCSAKALLVGGGVGVPPMYNLAKSLLSKGREVSVVLGFNTADELFYEQEFRDLGCKVYIATVDGSLGVKGFVTDAIREEGIEYDYQYACGPIPMLKALYTTSDVDGEFSFEERMACGFGGCMGCSCKTKYGSKRICKDGPVLQRGEIIW